MKISIAGKVMRDKDDAIRRNFESFVISVFKETRFKTHETHLHIINYAANAKSAAHRMLTDEYATSAEAMKASADKVAAKLAKNRVESTKFADTFTDVNKLTEFMQSLGLKITIANLKTIENHINAFAMRVADEEEMEAESREEHFVATIEKQLSSDELTALEEASGFGKETKAMNPNWGMF